MKGKLVKARLEIVTNQPYLTDFSRTIFANAKRRLQAELQSKRAALSKQGICSFSVLFEEVLSASFLSHFKAIATATACRDLKRGADEGLLSKEGEKALIRYCFLEPSKSAH